MPAADMPGIAFAPRLPAKLVARDDLIQRVERDAGHPLLIVRAAAGGGKSTLLAAWAKAYPRPGVWIALDRSSSTRLAFWQQVLEGIVAAELQRTSTVLEELVMSREIADRLRTLLHRGFSEVGPLTIVLDDFHEVADETVSEDIHWLVERGAPVQFVIATRAVSALERPEWMARVDTALLLSAALAFRMDEVATVADLFEAPEAAEEIHRAFAGWPLPTRAALLQLREGGGTPQSAIERVRDVGGNYVVDLLDETGYGDFLLRTSVAHRLTRELAAEIGGPEAALHLVRAEREGLGTWSEGAGSEEFALHPYLREHLERELIARMPDEVAESRRAYARDRANHGDPAEAARQYVAIRDLDALVDLVRAYHGELLHSRMYLTMLDSLDERDLRHHPELLAVQMLNSYGDPRVRRPGLARLASLATAVVYARLGGGQPTERISLLLALLTAQRVGGHYDQAVKTANRLATALALLEPESLEVLRGVIPSAWTQVATTLFYDEQSTQAEAYLLVAIDAAETWSKPWTRLHATSLQNLILAMRGDMATLRPRLEAARTQVGPSGWQGTYSASGYHFAEAYLALEHFDTPGARHQLDRLAVHEPAIEHWPLYARIRALAALVDGEPYVGLQRLEADIAAHADRPATSRPMTALLTATRAELLLADRQVHRAIEVLRSLRLEPSAVLVRARAHLLLGDDDEALGYAAPIAWSEVNIPRAKAEALLVVAVASHRLDQLADARDAARRAIALLEAFQLRRPLMMVPRRDLIAVLTAAGIPHEPLLDGVPDVFTTSNRDWSLTATELRVLALLERTGRTDDLAAELRVSANTVKSHLRQVYRKLGVKSRSEALGVAKLHGLLAESRGDERASG